MFLSTDDIVKLPSGHNSTPVPKVDCTTNRKTISSLKGLRVWLRENCMLEAKRRGDWFLYDQLFMIDPHNMSDSDIDMCNDYLNLT